MSEKGKSPRQFSRELKLSAVERMEAGESPSALARELGVRRKLLYEWKKRVAEGGPQNLHPRGRPRTAAGGVLVRRQPDEQRRIAELERLVGKQQALLSFFESALQQVEAETAGKAASTQRSGKSASDPEAS